MLNKICNLGNGKGKGKKKSRNIFRSAPAVIEEVVEEPEMNEKEDGEHNSIPDICIEHNIDFGPKYLEYNSEKFTLSDCAALCKNNKSKHKLLFSNCLSKIQLF